MESSLEFSSSLSSLPARCRTFKVILVGDSGVGKTCLTHRFCTGEFASRTEATVGVDFRERFVDIEGEKIKLQLWDTAGQERFRKSMVQHYYRSVHAVLFVYDVSCPASFWGLPVWIEECRQNSVGQDIPRFLIGNKSDLRDGLHPVGANGHVTHDQALKFAEAHRMTLFETSAKNPLNKETNGRRGQRDRGHRIGEIPHHQDHVEAIVLALAVRLKRQRRGTVLETRENNWPFKLPAKKRPEKSSWACTC